MSHPSDTPHSSHVESRSRKALRSYIIQASTLLEIVLSGLVLIGLLLSFIPLLTGTGDPSKGRSLFWNMPNNWGNDGPGINFNCAVRNGDWKLIYYYGTGKKELFNISDDIGEKNDLSTRHPEIVKRLSKELGDHLRKVDAQRPSFKATGKACPWPDEIN